MAQLSSSKRYRDTEMSTVDCVKKHTFALCVIAFLDFQKHFYEFFFPFVVMQMCAAMLKML